MAEGVAIAGGQVAAGVHDDPDAPPAPDPVAAPKGWTWNRRSQSWQARIRGPRIAAAPDPGADVSRETSAPAPGSTDPAPAWLQDDGGASNEGPKQEPRGDHVPFDQVPQQVKDDVAGLAGMVGAPVLAFLKSVDPYCGAAAADNYESVVDATLPLMLRSQKIVAYFTGDKSDWLLWGKLALALKPVATAVAEHHVLHTVEVVKDETTGAVTIQRGRGRGHRDQGAHLQPQPVDAQRYAA
jgi:hypothetical protein